MLADCMATTRRFGIVGMEEGDADPPRGFVGCIAQVESVAKLPDGRSDIIVEGQERFAVDRLMPTGKAYRVALVHPIEDVPEPGLDMHELADTVRTLFARVARAAQSLADDRRDTSELPEEPALLGFAVASRIEVDLALRQQVLASRRASERLTQVHDILAQAVDSLEWRASIHESARGNGRGPASH